MSLIFLRLLSRPQSFRLVSPPTPIQHLQPIAAAIGSLSIGEFKSDVLHAWQEAAPLFVRLSPRKCDSLAVIF